MRSVLIVTPFFAPQSHAAVFRAHKLVKYLPDHGWKPYVLTVDRNYHHNEDPALLDELPSEVEIVRGRYVEPTLRGLRLAMNGNDTTSRRERAPNPASSEVQAQGQRRREPRRLARQLYARALQRVIHSPDAHWPWYRPAVRAGRDLVARHDIDVVYTTCPPYTVHRIGHALQELGVRWVADFRDPVSYAGKNTSSTGHIQMRQRAIVSQALRDADAVTLAAHSFELIYNDMFGPDVRAPMHFIPTGVDTELARNVRDGASNGAQDDPYLIYVGEAMPDYGSEFFRYLGSAVRKGARKPRLLVVGNATLNRRRLEPVLKDAGLEELAVFIDHLPQQELYPLILGAEAAILAPGRTKYWWTLHAKLVDYMGLRQRVLAVVPDPSEARSVLTRTGLGVFLDGDEAQATATLTRFLNGELQLSAPNTEECDRFLASRQVADFAALFDSLV